MLAVAVLIWQLLTVPRGLAGPRLAVAGLALTVRAISRLALTVSVPGSRLAVRWLARPDYTLAVRRLARPNGTLAVRRLIVPGLLSGLFDRPVIGIGVRVHVGFGHHGASIPDGAK